jgi:3-isopropylmalate/(R)-2-methylmalate dehydratase large subunit
MSNQGSNQARTLFEKIWDRHVVADYGDGFALMHVDRLIVPDLSSRSLNKLRDRGIGLARPELVFGVADHAITTDPASRRSTSASPCWSPASLATGSCT